MTNHFPNGVYPTMVTPFTQENTIDYTAVEQLIHWYGAKGVAGIFAVCQSSEIFFLEAEERLALLRFILQHRPKGLPVIASGHVADDLSTQIAQANRFAEAGADAFIFISNRLALASEDDSVFLANMERFLRELDPSLPLGIYECPYPYKRLISPAVLRELAATGRFHFLKDTSCDLGNISQKLLAAKGTELKLFNANSTTLLESLKLGASGFSGVMANFHPELYVWLCNNFRTQPALAERVQDFVGFASLAEMQHYPINAKYYLQLDGLAVDIATRCRSVADFTPNRQLEIEQMHRLTQAFKQEVGIA